MKTGIELITYELLRKAEKYGFDNEFIKNHPEYYDKQQLINAAIYSLTLDNEFWPSNWGESFRISIVNKSMTERIIVAGAFLVNQLDKIENP